MPDLMPLQLLLATFAGWRNRHQAQVIDYLVEENRVTLKEQLRGRLRLTESQRRRLAAKGKLLGRRLLLLRRALIKAVRRAQFGTFPISLPGHS